MYALTCIVNTAARPAADMIHTSRSDNVSLHCH